MKKPIIKGAAIALLLAGCGNSELGDHGTGLRLPSDIAQRIAAGREFETAKAKLTIPGSSLAIILGAAQTSSQQMGCNKAANTWKWEDKGVFGPILDQGRCLSCYVYAPLGIVQASWVISRSSATSPPAPAKIIEISEEQQLSCNPGDCAGGGDPANVLNFLKATGGDPARTVPENFARKLPQCLVSHKPPYKILNWGYVGLQMNPSVDAIKESLCSHGPIAAAIWSNNALASFGGDQVFEQRDSAVPHNKANHAVIITGWDENQHAWRVRNSWGSTFGTGGYGWIHYGANNIGLVAYWADAESPQITPEIYHAVLELNDSALKLVTPELRALIPNGDTG